MPTTINNETAVASRKEPLTTWPIFWTLLIMKQLEQAETSRLRHDLYVGLPVY